jgi:hypothetical protein
MNRIYKPQRSSHRRAHGCPSSCGKLLQQIREVKLSLQREFSDAVAGHEQLLRQALNEAEALAWQTPYPHLFFPALAQEKAQAVGRWAFRQRSVRQTSPARAFVV